MGSRFWRCDACYNIISLDVKPEWHCTFPGCGRFDWVELFLWYCKSCGYGDIIGTHPPRSICTNCHCHTMNWTSASVQEILKPPTTRDHAMKKPFLTYDKIAIRKTTSEREDGNFEEIAVIRAGPFEFSVTIKDLKEVVMNMTFVGLQGNCSAMPCGKLEFSADQSNETSIVITPPFESRPEGTLKIRSSKPKVLLILSQRKICPDCGEEHTCINNREVIYQNLGQGIPGRQP